ncbi:hypothetical protein WDU94_006015 [Cyamophila willieti]
MLREVKKEKEIIMGIAQNNGNIGKHNVQRLRREASPELEQENKADISITELNFNKLELNSKTTESKEQNRTEFKEQIKIDFNRTEMTKDSRTDFNIMELKELNKNGEGLKKKKRKYKKRNATHLRGRKKPRRKIMTKEEMDSMNEKIRAYWRQRKAQGLTRRFPNRTRTWKSEKKKQEVVEKIRQAWARRKEIVGTKIFKEHGDRMRKFWKKMRKEGGTDDLFRIKIQNLRKYWDNLKRDGKTDIIQKYHAKHSDWMKNYWRTQVDDKRVQEMSIRMREFWRRRKNESEIEDWHEKRDRMIVACMTDFAREMKAKGIEGVSDRKELYELIMQMLDEEYLGLERREEHAIFMKRMWDDRLNEWGSCPLGDISERMSLFWTPEKRSKMSAQFVEYWRHEKDYYATKMKGNKTNIHN